MCTPKKRLAPMPSLDASEATTADETNSSTSSACSAEEDHEPTVQLITHIRSKRNHSSAFSAPRNFAKELGQAASNPGQTCLRLSNFIERSTRHDVCALRDLLLQDDRRWKSVALTDVCYASNFRRWAYKKENIHHHIQKLCLSRGIHLDCHAQMQLDLDDMSCASAIALLAEVKKHPEVRGLTVVGHLNAEQEQGLLKAVTSLVRLQDRDWDAVNVYTAFAAGSHQDPDEYEHWRSTMEHYMGVFSQLYERYNLPIDIRPSANE